MSFIEEGRPDPDEKSDILDSLIAGAEVQFGRDFTDDEVGVVRAFYDPVAEYFADQQSDIADVLDASQLDHATGTALDLRTAQIGVFRNVAEEATTRIQFTRSDPAGTSYSIPGGTVVQTDSTDPVEFETDTSTSIAFLDGFEDGDIDEYTEDTGSFSISTTTVYEGDESLEGPSSTAQIINDNHTVTEGDVIHCRVYANSNTIPQILFGTQDADSMYRAVVDASANEIRVELNDDGSVSTLGSPESITIPTGEWLHLEIDWKHEGEITLTLDDSSASELASVTATDSAVTFQEGGFGFRSGDSAGAKFWDNVTMSATSVDSTAIETGPEGNVGSDTLVIMADSVAGVENVSNPISASGGSDAETDDDLRERAKDELSKGIRATVPGLISQLQEADGTKSVNVIENDTSSTDAEGRPDHSVEAVVEVDSTEYDDIADVLADTKPGGIPLVGGYLGTEITRTVTLDNGDTVDVAFSVPNEVQIFVDVSLSKTSDYAGDDEVQDEIVNYIGGILNSNDEKDGELDSGDNVIYNKIMGAITEVDGVHDVTSLGVDTSSSPTATSNITIATGDVATSDATDGSLTVSSTDA